VVNTEAPIVPEIRSPHDDLMLDLFGHGRRYAGSQLRGVKSAAWNGDPTFVITGLQSQIFAAVTGACDGRSPEITRASLEHLIVAVFALAMALHDAGELGEPDA
jgi:hypothetical protein